MGKRRRYDGLDTVSNTIKDDELKESAIGRGLHSLAEDNPEVAFDYALQFESGGGGRFDMSYNPYMYSVLNSWIRKNPMDALNKVLTIESNSKKSTMWMMYLALGHEKIYMG